MNVAEYIVKYVEYREIEHAYVIVGGAALWICKALGQSKKLKFTFVNHEQAAVMGADGYARISGKAGVAFVTNGPALTNTVTGMAQAYVDSSPVVLFTGDSNSKHVLFERENNIRQYGTQDVKTQAIMEPVTKKCYTLTDPAKTAEVLAEAFWLAENGRPGPVCLDVPIDIQSSECPFAFPPVWTPPEEKKIPRETVASVLRQLKEAKRPLILAGQGVRLCGGTDLFRSLLPKLDVPVVNARRGIDTIEPDTPYFAGRCGNHGYRSSHFALQSCDVLLILGSRLAPNTTGYNVPDFAKQAKKILVECDPRELTQYGLTIEETVEGNILDFLRQAEELIREQDLEVLRGRDHQFLPPRGYRHKAGEGERYRHRGHRLLLQHRRPGLAGKGKPARPDLRRSVRHGLLGHEPGPGGSQPRRRTGAVLHRRRRPPDEHPGIRDPGRL